MSNGFAVPLSCRQIPTIPHMNATLTHRRTESNLCCGEKTPGGPLPDAHHRTAAQFPGQDIPARADQVRERHFPRDR